MPKEETKITIGILAMQGGFALHEDHLKKLKVGTVLVRKKEDLASLDGLIIPGGESTTIFSLLEKEKMTDPLMKFAEKKPIFGTCAGLILMARLGILPLSIKRNAYGRQSASFTTTITFEKKSIEAVFIRAPRINKLLSKELKVLAKFEKEPILIQYKHHMGATFHPELTDDLTLHRHFLKCLIQNT